jgi:hypothetical protein
VEATAEAAPVVGLKVLAPGAAVVPVGQMVVEAEAAVALTATRQRSLHKYRYRSCRPWLYLLVAPSQSVLPQVRVDLTPP